MFICGSIVYLGTKIEHDGPQNLTNRIFGLVVYSMFDGWILWYSSIVSPMLIRYTRGPQNGSSNIDHTRGSKIQFFKFCGPSCSILVPKYTMEPQINIRDEKFDFQNLRSLDMSYVQFGPLGCLMFSMT